MDRDDIDILLAGAEYPATPEHLIDVAIGNRAPNDFIDRLRGAGEGEFVEIDDVVGRLPA